MIAEAFQTVGFPVLPRVVSTPPLPLTLPTLERVLGRRPHATARFILRSATLTAPRDFDLSPYFEIIKFNLIEDSKFDYRKILWSEETREGFAPNVALSNLAK